MVFVAVCDDEKLFADSVAEMVGSIFEERSVESNVKVFNNLESLGKDMRLCAFNILLLDIILTDGTGMLFAKQLRAEGFDGDIIFMTSNTEYALQAYSVFPITFLEKPVKMNDLRLALGKCLEKTQKRVLLKIRDKERGNLSIHADSVLFIESQKHDIIFNCKNGVKYTMTGTFGSFAKTLPEDYFFHCHRSFIVNMRQVSRISNYQFEMSNGTILPIAKPLYSEAKSKFTEV